MAQLADRLSGWQLIAPDLPGYGRSTPRRKAGPQQLGRWLHALLDQLGVRDFILVGHDLGGLIALTDAVARSGCLNGYRHPAHQGGPQLRKLVLLDTTIYPAPMLVAGLLPAIIPPFAELSLRWHGRGGTSRANDRRRGYVVAMRQLLAPGTTISDAEWAEYAEPYGTVAGWQQTYRSIRALSRQAPFVLRCLHQLPCLTTPTALIWAEHDPFFPLATALRLQRAIGGATSTMQVIAGAGHFPQEDNPTAVARLIAAFVEPQSRVKEAG